MVMMLLVMAMEIVGVAVKGRVIVTAPPAAVSVLVRAESSLVVPDQLGAGVRVWLLLIPTSG